MLSKVTYAYVNECKSNPINFTAKNKSSLDSTKGVYSYLRENIKQLLTDGKSEKNEHHWVNLRTDKFSISAENNLILRPEATHLISDSGEIKPLKRRTWLPSINGTGYGLTVVKNNSQLIYDADLGRFQDGWNSKVKAAGIHGTVIDNKTGLIRNLEPFDLPILRRAFEILASNKNKLVRR